MVASVENQGELSSHELVHVCDPINICRVNQGGFLPSPKSGLKTGGYPDEAQRLSLELSTLSERQIEGLRKAPYFLMPREEREGYDKRRVRIEEVRGLLSKYSPRSNLQSSVG